MNDAQKIKIGIVLLIAQCLFLIMTLGFKSMMDRQAEKHGISYIIEGVAR